MPTNAPIRYPKPFIRPSTSPSPAPPPCTVPATANVTVHTDIVWINGIPFHAMQLSHSATSTHHKWRSLKCPIQKEQRKRNSILSRSLDRHRFLKKPASVDDAPKQCPSISVETEITINLGAKTIVLDKHEAEQLRDILNREFPGPVPGTYPWPYSPTIPGTPNHQHYWD